MIHAAETIIHGLSRLEVGTRVTVLPDATVRNIIVLVGGLTYRLRQPNVHSRIDCCYLFHLRNTMKADLCLTHYRFFRDPNWKSTKRWRSACAQSVKPVMSTTFASGQLIGSRRYCRHKA